MMFFTSDNHFNHANIIEYENRPFESVQAMNEEMIVRWNAKVNEKDDVYILGDFAFSNPVPILDALKGRKHLIIGNHDKPILHSKEASGRFVWIKDYYKLRIGKQRIVLFHFPIMVWDQTDFGSYHFYGHVHSNPNIRHPQFVSLKNSYNVGADVNNYEPVSLDEIVAKIK